MAERGLIYARASRDPQGGGTSVEKQLDRGLAVAEREGIEVVAAVRDNNRSASRGTTERQGFAEARRLIDEGRVDVLILWEVSRSSRDLEEFMSLVNGCADRGVSLSVSGTRYDPTSVDDWLPLVLQGVMAEAEARRIRKRNLDSVETNAARGTPHGRLPYGYRRLYDPRTGVLINQTPFVQVAHDGSLFRDGAGDLVPVLPEANVPMALSPEAQVLHDTVHAVLDGITLRRLCRDLSEAGIPTPRKPRAKTLADDPDSVVTGWEPATLRQLLLNPTIAGRRVHRREDIGEASWAPIVTYETWLRLRAYLKDPARLTVTNRRGSEARHLLTGIARCGECGTKVKASYSQKRLARAYQCRGEGCMAVTITADRCDEVVVETLFALFGRPGFREALSSAQKRQREKVDSGPDAAALIAVKEGERAEVEAMREAGEINLRAYAAETKRLDDAIEGLKEEVVARVESPAMRGLLSAETLREGWETADLARQREVVSLLFDVRVGRASITGKKFRPERVSVTPSKWYAEVMTPDRASD